MLWFEKNQVRSCYDFGDAEKESRGAGKPISSTQNTGNEYFLDLPNNKKKEPSTQFSRFDLSMSNLLNLDFNFK